MQGPATRRPVRGDHTLTVPGGRTLSYAVYGDPTGPPVLNCHGGLVSGHDVSPADETARDLGLCVISPDRPGINGTDRLPGYGLLPWVRADVVPLLDHLGVGPIGVMGWSEGGQYALAATFELAERVTACAVIAGCPPLDDRATLAQSNRLDRVLAILSRRAPVALRIMAAGTRVLARRAPRVLLRAALRGQTPAEAAAVRALGGWFPTILGEGAAQGQGMVDEYQAAVAPWGFAPEDLSGTIGIYQGSADTLVPEAWGRMLADRLPRASLTLYPGEGHFIALTRRGEVLRWLAGCRPGPGK